MKVLLTLVALSFAAPAVAQAPVRPQGTTSALKGLDTSGPIDFDAARLEVLDAQNQALLSGSVVIRQGKLTLNADRVKLLYARKAGGNPEIDRLDARGSVVLVSPSERATGNSGIYDVAQRIITLIGNVTLDRGGSVLRGERLVLNLASGLTSFDGAGGGAGAGSKGRVTGRLLVPERGSPKP
jgi:lipopolysaccharide export system protein LptA